MTDVPAPPFAPVTSPVEAPTVPLAGVAEVHAQDAVTSVIVTTPVASSNEAAMAASCFVPPFAAIPPGLTGKIFSV